MAVCPVQLLLERILVVVGYPLVRVPGKVFDGSLLVMDRGNVRVIS
jgi:hypothetical protein